MSKKIKILIVDDELQNTSILEEIIDCYDSYQYKIAHSGKKAIEILGGYCPDIILLDVMLGDITGFEVCEYIRKTEKHRLSKIIMLSGRSSVSDRLKGYEVGADDYVPKPFVEEELMAKLNVYSKLSRMEEVDQLKTTALNLLKHETRTPLNGIFLGSDLLKDIPELPSKAKEYVSVIRSSGEKIKELLEKISRYMELRDGVFPRITDFYLVHLLQECIDLVLQTKKISINLECDTSMRLMADKELLKEALVTVIENSSHTEAVSDTVNIYCSEKNSQIKIIIENETKAIDSEMIYSVFEGLYFNDILHHQKGTGLRLAIAKQIIDGHDGDISLERNNIKGIFFQILLPARL